MSIAVVTHLNFRGEARAALEFYQTVFGGELTIVSYGDAHSSQDPAEAKQVMWGQVAAQNGFKVMAFDALPARLPFERGENSFYVSARFTSDEEAKQRWEKLRVGANVRQALGPAPWAPTLYGMLEDQFGIVWVVDVEPSQNPA
jgi:PhnB protein